MIFTFDLSSALEPILSRYPQNQIFVFSNHKPSCMLLPSGNTPYPTLLMPPGEGCKDLSYVENVWDFLLANHATRQALLICIGGGIATDLGGFAASTYKRGIDFLNIPTTLLAMVDASVGGKTGFNYRGIKNCIGTFADPVETVIRPTFLQTLPIHEFLSGFAEMLKHALLSSEEDWNQLIAFDLEMYFHTFSSQSVRDFAPLIEKSLAIKQRYAAADPEEHNTRRALNFGHTVGHALESLLIEQEANTASHGYCVLWGMVAELYMSVVQCGFPRRPLQQLTRLMIERYGRPACNCRDYDRLLERMSQDKKNLVEPEKKQPQAPEPHFTLLHAIGEPLIDQTVPAELLTEALDYLFSL